MFSLLVAILLSTSGMMQITKPDGSLDVSSLSKHIEFLEESVEQSMALVVKTAELESKLQLALSALNTTQGELKTTQKELGKVKSDLNSTEAEVAALQVQLKSSNATGGALFTRWGRDTCPSDNKIVYKGYTGGTFYDAKASSATILCLPEHPLYAAHSSFAHAAFVYGTEYEASPGTPFAGFSNEDMPCVVCESETRRSAVMVPARDQCYPGWNLEYSGYLMGAGKTHASAEFICVDKEPETIPGGHDNEDGQTLMIAESKCGSLPCPPYVDNWELTCSVCTK